MEKIIIKEIRDNTVLPDCQKLINTQGRSICNI